MINDIYNIFESIKYWGFKLDCKVRPELMTDRSLDHLRIGLMFSTDTSTDNTILSIAFNHEGKKLLPVESYFPESVGELVNYIKEFSDYKYNGSTSMIFRVPRFSLDPVGRFTFYVYDPLILPGFNGYVPLYQQIEVAHHI